MDLKLLQMKPSLRYDYKEDVGEIGQQKLNSIFPGKVKAGYQGMFDSVTSGYKHLNFPIPTSLLNYFYSPFRKIMQKDHISKYLNKNPDLLEEILKNPNTLY